MTSRGTITRLLAVLVGATLLVGVWAAEGSARPYRAFSKRSYWNKPLDRKHPAAPNSGDIMRYLIRTNDPDHIVLAGGGSDGKWGMPVYWGSRRDPRVRVRSNCRFPVPPEFDAVRIPRDARPDPTSDGALTVYDRRKGVVVGLWRAHRVAGSTDWTSCGGSVYYLRSNGLHGKLARSNERRNAGHRGFPPPTWAVRYDEIKAGAIRHVLKIAVDVTKCAHVFPAVGDECGTRDFAAPPEGTRIRIKPKVDLRSLHLSRAAFVIARALKRYGAVIGDQSGGPVTLKLENTVAEGRGYLWKGVLSHDALRNIPLRLFQVVRPPH